MDTKIIKQANKKPYITPEVQAFESLKEITLANTCGCDYWGNHFQSCAFCANPTGEIGCPDPPSSCTTP